MNRFLPNKHKIFPVIVNKLHFYLCFDLNCKGCGNQSEIKWGSVTVVPGPLSGECHTKADKSRPLKEKKSAAHVKIKSAKKITPSQKISSWAPNVLLRAANLVFFAEIKLHLKKNGLSLELIRN